MNGSGKYSKVLTIILIVVIIAIIGLLIFWAVDMFRKSSIDSDAENGILDFQNQVQTNNVNTSGNNISSGGIVNPYGNNIISGENNVNNNSGGSSVPTKYKGYDMVGYLEIPKTGIKYPVLSEQDFSKDAIEVALAVLYGPGLNQIGNTVIVGHNYRNGTFFSDNNKLANGDKILITDTSGKTLTYVIYKKFQTTPEDASYVTRDTEGKREITLSTCTDDSQNRIIIQARES